MADHSKIEWTEATWNPVTGCSKLSAGCKNCYAERLARRMKAMGAARYQNAFEVTVHPDALNAPALWHKPRMVFVNSMSDLFHEKVSLGFIKSVFEVIRQTPRHQFQILTKRAEIMAKLAPKLEWPDNLWMGVSVENQDCAFRMEYLRKVPAKVKFISFEPLLGPIHKANLTGINWVIVGGESGPYARPMQPEWVTGLRDICVRKRIPFFFKQWGGINKKKAGRSLEGHIWNEMPAIEKNFDQQSLF
jgi:protein gp37